ncbi:MAG: GSCFA domain-containing protein [Acidimicrobiales bacterium]|nr:GSCFA domain-containing protein [Acidimicrobiales bacterium]
MSILELADNAATANFGSLPASRWYANGIDPDDFTGPYAVQRLKRDLFIPELGTPGFALRRTDSVYAIGSCFARGIENTLVANGFDVKSVADEFDHFELSGPQVTGRGFMNKYTTHSIRAEIEWALDPSTPFPADGLIDNGDGTWADPAANPTLKWVDHATTIERRETISSVVRRLTDCRLVVITLGLVEVWRDTHTGMYLNITPTPAMMRAHPGRYRFEVSGFTENRANVEAIWELLARTGCEDQQIVVTVSPVPLMATFSDRDIVVANTYSKSLLRTVAEDWSHAHDNVHYFPSYEIVTNSNRGLAWMPDGRHVRGELVGHIMQTFLRHYLDG